MLIGLSQGIGLAVGCVGDDSTQAAEGADASLGDSAATADGAGGADVTVPDSSTADVASPTPDAGADAGVVVADAAPDVALVGCDLGQPCCAQNLCQNAHRCLGGTCSCVQALVGDYVIRTGGRIVNKGTLNSVSLHQADGGDAAVPLDGIVAAIDHSGGGCGLRADKTVWCWGEESGANDFGELGQGNTTPYPTYRAVQVKMNPDAGAGTILDDVATLSTGTLCYYSSRTCAIRGDGTLWCWGYGEFVLNTVQSYPIRIDLPLSADGGLLKPTQITMGRRHACALADGDVYCWGSNVYGTLGRGLSPVLPLVPTKVAALPAGQAVQVVTGFEHTCARLANGELYCWGINTYGQLGVGAPVSNGCSTQCEHTPKRVEISAGVPLTGVTDVMPTYAGTCATLTSGELYCWGEANGNAGYATPYKVADAGVAGIASLTWCGSPSTPRILLADGGAVNMSALTCP